MGLTIADSVAIKILDSGAILTGIGNELHLYAARTAKHSTNVTLPHGSLSSKIHGIVAFKNKVLLYGEKEFKLLKYTDNALEFELIFHDKIFDWIKAAKFIDEGNEFVLVTCHSVILRFSCENENFRVIDRVSCEDKSTLYCATIYGSKWHNLIIFGGNAFGELLIWQPTLLVTREGHCLPRAALQQTHQSHNGVVFSIDYNHNFQILSTTSDDRSIKFWHIGNVVDNWLNATVEPIASGFGHASRVFQGKMFQYRNKPFAITVGEDSNFCVWHCDGELLHKHYHQFGSIIWNFDYDELTNTLYTSGSTGNLLDYSLLDVLITTNQVKPAIMPQSNIEDCSEYIAKVKFLTESIVIGLTNHNELVYTNIKSDENNSWKSISAFTPYKSSVLEISNDLIALCGFQRVTILKFIDYPEIQFKIIYDGKHLKGMLRAFQFLNDKTYLMSDEYGDCLLIRQVNQSIEQYPIDLPACKERWLTSALKIEDRLLLMNRSGHLILYKFNSAIEYYEKKDMIKNLHGNYGATVIRLVSGNEDVFFIKTAGHDGSMRTVGVDRNNNTIKMYAREIVPIAWIEAIKTIPPIDIFLGFNDNRFVAWSNEHAFMIEVPCGGGHRCWHYLFTNEKNIKYIKLVFIKNKQVILYKLRLFNDTKAGIVMPPRNTWHTKACNIMQVLEFVDINTLILISAGDDNLIKITTLNTDCIENENLMQRAEVHTHISNIRALKVHKINDDACLIVSGGGRAQLCITKLYFQNYQIEEMLNHTLKPLIQDIIPKHSFNIDPETRIMSIDMIYDELVAEYIIFLACSDGFLRKIILNVNLVIQKQIEFFYGCCLLRVQALKNIKLLLITTTKGILHLCDFNLKAIYGLERHLSGIDSLDVIYDEITHELHILTGGDDQAVAYSKMFYCDSHNKPGGSVNTTYMSQMHTAQVTATCLSINDNKMCAFTAGVDQKIIKFNLQTENADKVVKTCVADVKGLCVTTKDLCLVYGSGLQCFNFANE